MKILSSQVTVSDADVMIKLFNAGHLGLLGNIFSEVIVPGKVFEEVNRKIRRQLNDTSLMSEFEWLKNH